MKELFGAWVAVGTSVGTLMMVLALYWRNQRQRELNEKLESSFFTWSFAWRLLLPEALIAGFSFVVGIGVGAVGLNDWALLVFLGVLVVLVLALLGWVHYQIIVEAHGRASRARRRSGVRSQLV